MCATKAQPAATDVTRPDNGAEDATTALYRAAIGPVNLAYYLPIFQRFEAADRVGPTWNWAAALCTLNWMAYRRLWGGALMYAGAVVGLVLMIFGIGRLVFHFSEFTELGLIFVFIVLAIGVPGVFGNALFYTQARKRMAHALAMNANFDEACAMLARQSSSKPRLIALALANVAAAGVAVGGYVFAPQGGMLPRNVASGRALDAALDAAAKPAVMAASSPILAASSPVAVASSPALTASEPTAAASSPVLAASSPAKAASDVVEEIVSTPPKLAVVKPSKNVVPRIKPEKIVKPQKAAKTQKAAKAPAPKEPDEERFYLNVGLFADDNNARNAHVKLVDAGLPSVQLEMKTSNGPRTRVRVGPFDSLTDADRAAKKIRALGLEAALVRP